MQNPSARIDKAMLALTVLTAALLPVTAFAVPLPPGATVSLPGTAVAINPAIKGTIVQQQSVPFVLTLPGPNILHGIVQDTVIRENASKHLDFYVRILTQKPFQAPYLNVQETGYKGLPTDANYRTDLPGLTAPDKAARNATGASIVFHYPGIVLQPGITGATRAAFVRTPAKNFVNGVPGRVSCGAATATVKLFGPAQG